MDFIEIALTDLNGEAAETIGELFNRYGYGGAVMESFPPNFDKVTVRTVIPSEDDHRLREIELMLTLIGQALPGGLPVPRLQFVGKSDWAESWKAHFHPVRVGRSFVIKPSWRDYAPAADDLIIEIDPGLAFGSGLHPTTQLCLKILEDMPLPGKTLFDVGTGSGILALAALKLGIARVRAVDIDDIAVRVTQENFERNGYPQSAEAEVAVGSAGDAGGRQWDIVVANILANTIIELLPDLKAALAPGGSLILSGIIAEQEASVAVAAAGHRLRLSERQVEEDWIALVFSVTPSESLHPAG
ncbi:MAG: 50S ribosomal protein L11 methyltransferase [Anaerolineales bacterium]|nr:50S ribosomal protein L11 methyltransferase [Anaerolineales bacterium]